MSDIYTQLQAQQTALQTVPTFGVVVSLDKPPAGEDPAEQIYLEPELAMETSDSRSTISVTWSAVVVADPIEILSRSLDAQDAMLSALADSGCPFKSLGRAPIGDRQPWARTLLASVLVTFTTRDPGA